MEPTCVVCERYEHEVEGRMLAYLAAGEDDDMAGDVVFYCPECAVRDGLRSD